MIVVNENSDGEGDQSKLGDIRGEISPNPLKYKSEEEFKILIQSTKVQCYFLFSLLKK